MLIENVKKLSPFCRIVMWITERESIRLQKEAGKPPPWTDDVILQSYRFTNARRMDDRVSRWLYEHWYQPHQDHPNAVIACTLARYLNRIETLAAIDFPRLQWMPHKTARTLKALQASGAKVFGQAYMLPSMGYANKIDTVIEVVSSIADDDFQADMDSMEDTHRQLCTYRGLGSFLAGQVVADLRWCLTGTWADKMSWAPLGPGSQRGMNRLHERDLDTHLSQEQFTAELQELIDKLAVRLPRSITSRLEAQDYQSCLCELDKYDRVLWGEGRPKQSYPGGGMLPPEPKVDPQSKPTAHVPAGTSLKTPQLKILKALRNGDQLTRAQIAQRAGVDPTKVGDYAGPRPVDQTEKARERWNFPDLYQLGLVTVGMEDINGRDIQVYRIAAKGKAQLKFSER